MYIGIQHGESGADRSPPTSISTGSAPRTRIAYLTNAYPKPSHSFIRREILALEHQGIEVQRFTVRAIKDELPDPADRAERGRTFVLVDGRYSHLAVATVREMSCSPVRFLRAFRMALEMGRRGGCIIRHLAYLVEACRLLQELRAANLRHVHVHFGTNPAAVARLTKVLGGISYSMTVHGPDEFDAPAQLSLPDKIADADRVVAISDHGRGQLMRWSRPADWTKIEVVRCGVDRTFLRGSPEEGDAGYRSASLVCVARLNAQKGLPLLIDAAAEVSRRGCRFRLQLIGDGELRAHLEARIIEQKLERHIRILGWRSAADVRSELAAARALVLPSFAEGLPVVLMEALALGRPVVATAVAGIPELVDRSCGWIVPAGSLVELAGAMQAVLQATPEELARMGRAGQARVQKYHDADANAAALAALLRPLARQG